MKVILKNQMELYFDERLQYRRASMVAAEELRHDNPVIKQYRNRRNVPKNIPEFVYSCEFLDKEYKVSIPRGCGSVLRRILKECNIKLNKEDIVDETTKGHKIEFKHKFEPRDQLQAQAIKNFVEDKRRHLIINGACAFGKTFCALKSIEYLKISTLILVDENSLLEQWIENIKWDCEFNIDKLGIIGNGKEVYEGKDIIVASKDTLINRPKIMEYINEHIGFVIVDEAHVASADVFQRVLKNLTPYRVLGLTATPKRSDGLSYLMHEQIGPICYRANRADLIAIGSVMNPILRPIYVQRPGYFAKQFALHKQKEIDKLKSIEPVDGKYKIGNRFFKKETWEKRIRAVNGKVMDDWTFLSNTVENDIETIKEISKIIKHHYDKGDQSICICKKIKFAKTYLETLKGLGVKEDEIAIILGETKTEVRNELIERAKAKKLKIIITSSILDKGISIDSANVLFLLYPSKNENSTEQRIGRVSRTQKGKEYAIVYDFIYDHGMFFSQFYKSQNIEYRECRFNVEKYCTDYNENAMNKFINNCITKFFFEKDATFEEINTNNMETLNKGNTLIIKS